MLTAFVTDTSVSSSTTLRPWPARAGADIVVGNLVLEHIADLRPVFTEVRRNLKPGGPMFRCELHSYLDTRWDPDWLG